MTAVRVSQVEESMTVARITIAKRTTGFASQRERDLADAIQVYRDVRTLSPQDRAGILHTILKMGRAEAVVLAILEEHVAESQARLADLLRDFVHHSVGIPNAVVVKIIKGI